MIFFVDEEIDGSTLIKFNYESLRDLKIKAGPAQKIAGIIKLFSQEVLVNLNLFISYV